MSKPAIKLLCLHGNPGRPEDFRLLLQQVNIDSKDCLVPDLMTATDPVKEVSDYLDQEMRNDPSPLLITGYSWGAYLACKLLSDPRFLKKYRAKHVFLICPYIKPEGKLSFVAKLLMSAPLINRLIAGEIAKSRASVFRDKVFGQEAHLYQASTDSFLDKPETWLNAFRLKNYQEKHPVTAKTLLAVNAFLSDNDPISDYQTQLAAVRNIFTETAIQTFESQNHALLWTKPKEIAHVINQLIIDKR